MCKTFGAACEVYVENAYPVTMNDPSVASAVFQALKSIPGTRTMQVPRMLVAEDFSFFLQKIAGTYYFLGTHNEKLGCIHPNHSSRFKIDEDVLKYGSASLAFEFTRRS